MAQRRSYYEANPGITDANLISAGQTLNMPGGTYSKNRKPN
jgi:hypothetical protein